MLKKTKTLAVVTGLFLSSQASFATKGQLFSAQTAQDVVTALSDGTNVNVADEDGTTALHIAVRDGKKNVVWALLFNGADTKACKKHVVTPWMHSVGSSAKNLWKRTKAAFKRGNHGERQQLRQQHHNTQNCMKILTAWPFMSESTKSMKKAELGLTSKQNS